MNDKQYIAALQKGDEHVFADLYETYRGRFFGYIRKFYRKSDDYIADLYQESCVVLWQNVQNGKLTPEKLTSSIETYIIGVAKYILMARDRRYKEILADRELSTFSAGTDEDSLRDETERDGVIQSVVNSMDEPCCTLLDKFYWDELSGEEIANQMNYKNTDPVNAIFNFCMHLYFCVLTVSVFL